MPALPVASAAEHVGPHGDVRHVAYRARDGRRDDRLSGVEEAFTCQFEEFAGAPFRFTAPEIGAQSKCLWSEQQGEKPDSKKQFYRENDYLFIHMLIVVRKLN